MRSHRRREDRGLAVRERTPKDPFGVEPTLCSAPCAVPAGHRTEAAADTVGPLRTEHVPALSGLAFSSPAM